MIAVAVPLVAAVAIPLVVAVVPSVAAVPIRLVSVAVTVVSGIAVARVTEMKQAVRAHELKYWPDFFKKTVNGKKTFEVRRNDRNYMLSDVHQRYFAPGDTSVESRPLRGGAPSSP